jgi:hypothetical protein
MKMGSSSCRIAPCGLAEIVSPRQFTAREIALLGTDSDAAIAKRLRRHEAIVGRKRRQLGIPSARDRAGKTHRRWTQREIAQLGRASDARVAAKVGRSADCVCHKRSSLGIPAFPRKSR